MLVTEEIIIFYSCPHFTVHQCINQWLKCHSFEIMAQGGCFVLDFILCDVFETDLVSYKFKI